MNTRLLRSMTFDCAWFSSFSSWLAPFLTLFIHFCSVVVDHSPLLPSNTNPTVNERIKKQEKKEDWPSRSLWPVSLSRLDRLFLRSNRINAWHVFTCVCVCLIPFEACEPFDVHLLRHSLVKANCLVGKKSKTNQNRFLFVCPRDGGARPGYQSLASRPLSSKMVDSLGSISITGPLSVLTHLIWFSSVSVDRSPVENEFRCLWRSPNRIACNRKCMPRHFVCLF